jgi:hypothetical protein
MPSGMAWRVYRARTGFRHPGLIQARYMRQKIPIERINRPASEIELEYSVLLK